MKVAFIDVETTGLTTKEADVIQVGALIRINNKIVDEFNAKCQPIKWNTISEYALKVNNNTIETLRSYQTPKEAWKKFFVFIEKHFNGEKYVFGGQNTPFDWKFMVDWWNTNKDANVLPFSAYFKENHLDLMKFTKEFQSHKLIDVPNTKLATVVKALGVKVEGDLHDALTDIRCTDAAVIECVHRANKLKRDNPKHPVGIRFASDRLLQLI